MYSFKLAFRSFFKKGQYTLPRIVSLAAGLAFGILLLAEVFYFHSYDSFYPDADRVYAIHSSFKTDKSQTDFESYPSVSGAIAPGMKAEVPGVEAATRLNPIGNHVFYNSDKQRYTAKVMLADENWAEVIPRPMIRGNSIEILQTNLNCMVSSTIAEAMGGNVIGEVIELKKYPGKELTIKGVFEALPENTNFNYDILISMVSITEFYSWDGSVNWLGNDRYKGFVKLTPGVDAKSLAPAVRKMQEKHQDIVKLEMDQGGEFLRYTLKPIEKIYSSNVQDKIIVLLTIAFAVLLVALLNYVLLSLSSLVNRAKTSAIHKTCGAHGGDVKGLIFSESLLFFIASIILAGIIIWAVRPYAEIYLGHQLLAVFTPYVVWPVLGVLIVLVGATSYFPARFFASIPVSSAFRQYKQGKNKWKLALLSVQFIVATLIVTVLVVVTLQYDAMVNANHGYQSKGVYYCVTSGMEGSKLPMVIDELRKLPEVEKVGLGERAPLHGASGNNVMSPDHKRDYFNVADFYSIDENYLSILNIPVIQGNTFSTQTAAEGDVLISKKGADMLRLNTHWKNGVTGEFINISEHGESTIQGIFPDFVIGSIAKPDERPSVFFYTPEERFKLKMVEHPSESFIIILKVRDGMERGVMAKLKTVFDIAMPQNDAEVMSLEAEQVMAYSEAKGFRNAMMAGNMIVLLITIIGLLGYTTNEATRRQKELAIRRINGATLSNIIQVFVVDLHLIVVPAVAVGLFGAWYTVQIWMHNFSEKVPLHWSLFAICSLSILMVASAIAVYNYVRIANQNPVKALRYE
ncbi:MAG: ABC transporter permease [Bacteroidales bacterium]|nr:ABC transporter permease [Bacteroidales bacterium]